MPVTMKTGTATASKREAARWSLTSNLTLLLLKTGVGLLTGSVGILAEVVNSAGDLVASLVAWFSVRVSDEPPDRSHAYGHGKIENLSGILTSTLVLIGGFYAVYEAVQELLHPKPLVQIGWGVGVMAVSAVVNALVSRHIIVVGQATDSPALDADGHQLRTDVLTSLGVMLGLVLVKATGERWWDSVAALIVSAMILRVGFGLARDALQTLSDTALPAAEEQALKDVLRRHSAVLDFHKLRTRKSGSHRHVDVHVQIADTNTFVEAHRLTEELEDQLRAALPNLHPIIHIEPYEAESAHQREAHGEKTAEE
jgi:cation diffusion facilitator family transporter